MSHRKKTKGSNGKKNKLKKSYVRLRSKFIKNLVEEA